MPKVKKSNRIAERREGPTKYQQQSKEKRGQSVNRDTSETVEKSPEVDHVVGNPKPCPESGAATNAAKLGLSDDEICKAVKRAFVAARDRPGGVSLGLQRRKWRYSEDVNAMNKSLKRLNSSIAAELVRKGGGYIKYPDIKPNDELLFDRDGVHLSEKGTEIFLNTICAAIEQFSKTGILVYPKLY
uniref:Uncharacterized protein n=1 Tax=Magallana gigas TaxID=29159 RepID=A0A8W8HPW3_MAGGI